MWPGDEVSHMRRTRPVNRGTRAIQISKEAGSRTDKGSVAGQTPVVALCTALLRSHRLLVIWGLVYNHPDAAYFPRTALWPLVADVATLFKE